MPIATINITSPIGIKALIHSTGVGKYDCTRANAVVCLSNKPVETGYAQKGDSALESETNKVDPANAG